tara:strand:- start:1213 stop:2124 length:912 start_codon:yes stop_codon:yes gene_type:complete
MAYIFYVLFFLNFIENTCLFTPRSVSKIKVFNSNNDKLRDKTALFIPNNVNNHKSYEYYSDFLNNMDSHVKVLISEIDIDQNMDLSKEIGNDNNLIIISHSNSAINSINLCKNNEIVDTLILIDPINIDYMNTDIYNKTMKIKDFTNITKYVNDLSCYVNDKKEQFIMDYIIPEKLYQDIKIENNTVDIENYTESDSIVYIENKKDIGLKNVLILSNDLSNKWSFFPFIPPIGLLGVNTDHFDKNTINYMKKDVSNYGHFDILDIPWCNVLHNTISKGNKDRSTINIINYHKLLSDTISDFIK